MPTPKHMAWMAGIALATILAFENYKAKRGAPAKPGGLSLFGRAAA